MTLKVKAKPIEAWAIVDKVHPQINPMEIFLKKDDVVLDKDEEWVRVVIRVK